MNQKNSYVPRPPDHAGDLALRGADVPPPLRPHGRTAPHPGEAPEAPPRSRCAQDFFPPSLVFSASTSRRASAQLAARYAHAQRHTRSLLELSLALVLTTQTHTKVHAPQRLVVW